MKIRLILFFLFFLGQMNAQEKTIRVRTISGDSIPAIGVQAMNLVNEKTAVSDGNGYFEISAKEGDMIVFPSVNYEYKRRIIEAVDLQKGSIVVKLVAKAIELEEVVVLGSINPEDLGIVPRGQKIMTRAEKKLYGATSGPLDIIVNALTGRTKMLKKELAISKKEELLAKLDRMFTNEYFVEKLGIPEDYADGFRYYCVDYKEVADPLRLNNKLATALALTQLSQDYIAVINDTTPLFDPKEEKKEEKK